MDPFELEQVVRRRNQIHGWRWPHGAQASVTRDLGIAPQRLQEMRLELLLRHVRATGREAVPLVPGGEGREAVPQCPAGHSGGSVPPRQVREG